MQNIQEGSLVGRLTGVQNNFVLGVAAATLLADEQARNLLRGNSISYAGLTVPLEQVAALLANARDRDEHLKQFGVVLLRDLVTLAFELAEYHANRAGRSGQLQAEPWYAFADVVRNCVSHNFRISFRRSKKKLPIVWRDRCLTVDMDGKPMSLDFFGWLQAWQLFCDIKSFAEKEGL